ncbi:hypothetical protein [Elioraea sp.]|uniref:hypothetical protein n=1 Tax=Elioraea sp. TaxID=2185103 RepID=UPI0025BE702B|nr:hypothetical protein [Elioraea sp.]
MTERLPAAQLPAARTIMAVRLFGATMIAIGAVSYLLPASPHWTALIPAIIGGIAIAASLPRWPAMAHAAIAVVLAGIALFGSGSALPQLPALLAEGGTVGNPAAVAARSAAAVVSLLLLLSLAVIRPWRR